MHKENCCRYRLLWPFVGVRACVRATGKEEKKSFFFRFCYSFFPLYSHCPLLQLQSSPYFSNKTRRLPRE